MPTMNLLIKIFLIVSLHTQFICAEVVSLPKFNVDINETSVSGFSSGGYMAGQVQVAHSAIIKGAGIVASGPYGCFRNVPTYFLCLLSNTPDISQSIIRTNQWSGNLIDNTTNMRKQRLFLLAESKDYFQGVPPMEQTYNYYVTEGQFIPAENVKFVVKPFGHTFPTNLNIAGTIGCTQSRDPFVGRCGYDGAGLILKQIYGKLNPRLKRSCQRTGHLIKFDQSEFIMNPTQNGLDTAGYAYIPKSCAERQKCRLHFVFHGCFMAYFYIGLDFVQKSGFDLWADTNNIILVFPQTYFDPISHTMVTNETFQNGVACWDFGGIYDPLYDTKRGKQITFIKNIIDRISN